MELAVRPPTPHTSTPTPTLANKSIFPFFSLPPELRDEIYYHALTFKHKLPAQSSLRLRLRRAPLPHLTLISHRFRHEYLSRAHAHTTLILVDRDEFLGDPITLAPSLCKWLGKVEVHLALACNETCHGQPHFYGHTHSAPPLPVGSVVRDGCRVRKELRMHAKWLAALLRGMRGVREVVVKVVLDPHEMVAGCVELLRCDQWRFSGLEGLVGWEVFYCEYEVRPEGRWNFARPRRKVLEWRGGERSSGELVEVVEVEKKVVEEKKEEKVDKVVEVEGALHVEDVVVESIEEVGDGDVVKDV